MTHLPTFNPLYTLFPRQKPISGNSRKSIKTPRHGTRDPQRIKNFRLIFICLMADLDLPISDLYELSQFADDTQYLCIEDQREQHKEPQ